jgi:hypothetical protein
MVYLCVQFHTLKLYNFKNSTHTVAIGKKRKEKNIIASSTNNITSMKRSAKIRKVLINIPIPREKPTNPCLYSFLSGLKKVLIKVGSENNTKNASLRDKKNLSIPTGASIYQNFKKISGKIANVFMTNF